MGGCSHACLTLVGPELGELSGLLGARASCCTVLRRMNCFIYLNLYFFFWAQGLPTDSVPRRHGMRSTVAGTGCVGAAGAELRPPTAP